MTWTRVVPTPATLLAYHIGEDNKGIRIQINGTAADLSEEDAASLGGYLLGSTNNQPKEAGE